MAGLKKKVDVHCYRPFKLGITRFAGYCNGIILDADAISICLQNKAMVSEVLKNGKRVQLDFSNYNKKNPMGYDVETEQNEFVSARAYNVTTMNKTGETKVQNVQPVNIDAPVSDGNTAPLNTTLVTKSDGVIITDHKDTAKEEKLHQLGEAPTLPAAELTATVNVEKAPEKTDVAPIVKETENTSDKKEDKSNNNGNNKNNKHHK